MDGAAVSANLGVNPSLTITAQAERAIALWPNRGDADPRPALGAGYQQIAPGRAAATRPSRTPRPARCGCRSAPSRSGRPNRANAAW